MFTSHFSKTDGEKLTILFSIYGKSCLRQRQDETSYPGVFAVTEEENVGGRKKYSFKNIREGCDKS